MLRRFINLFRSQEHAADIREELEFHRAASQGSFGNRTQMEERTREASIVVWLETLLQDIRYGVRQLGKSPVLLMVAVLSLGLGIGANTAIFTLINAVMLQSLPVQDPSRLALFYDGIATGVYDGGDFTNESFSFAAWKHLNLNREVFQELCAFRQGTDRVVMHVEGAANSGPQERAVVHLVSGSYFDVLGVGAATGRMFRQADDTVTAPPLAVISYEFWRSRFHLDPSVVGKAVVLNGGAFTIAGVAPREFFGERIERPPDFWVPLSFQPQILQRESWLPERNVHWLNLMGRLKRGVTLQAASSAVTTQLRQLYREQAGTNLSATTLRKLAEFHVLLKPGGSGISGLRFRYSEPLHVLMAVTGLVLLIACANIATLLLARDSARRPEFLARLALGASPVRLIRQVLTESVLLSTVGGIVGAAFAWWSVHVLVALFEVTTVVNVRPNLLVLGFGIAVSLLTGIGFGLIPAFRSSRIEPRPGNSFPPTRIHRTQFSSGQALVVLQVALSLVLLLSSGLLARSLFVLQTQDLGFNRDNVLIVQTDPRLAGYQKNELFSLYRELDTQLNQIPGVDSASIASYTPISGNSSTSNFSLQGYKQVGERKMDIRKVGIAPRFFAALQIPIRVGRTIDERDTPASPTVVVVNESFVKTYLAERNPIGQRIALGAPFSGPGYEIVGVVGNSKFFDLRDEAVPMAFFALWQTQREGDLIFAGDLILRSSQPSSAVAAATRKALNHISSKLPVLGTTTLNGQIDGALKQQKLMAGLCSAFGALAILLAAIGIYGTVAYSVARRTMEIGIRMAIGAQRRQMLWMVMRESIVLTLTGLIAGVPLAFASARWIKSLLFGVTFTDPPAFIAAIVLVTLLVAIAALIPARRAASIDPIRALRYE